MGWVRLHRLPRECRATPEGEWTARQKWLKAASFQRYLTTPDGREMTDMMRAWQADGCRIGYYHGIVLHEDRG